MNMNIHDFTKKTKSMSSQASSNIKSVLFEQSRLLRHELQARSPVDKGIFRSNWTMSRIVGTPKRLSVSIKNPTSYGHWLDEGGVVKGPPWYFSGTDGTVSPSGKLKVSGGKVWAGGLSPSGFVEGGIIDFVIPVGGEKETRILNSAIDAVLGAL